MSHLLRVLPPCLDSRQTKITYLDCEVIVVEKYIVAFQVSVDNVFMVQVPKVKEDDFVPCSSCILLYVYVLHSLRRLTCYLDRV